MLTVPEPTDRGLRHRLAELVGLFGLLGVIGFGGPAAHVALMRREVVDRRGWMTDKGVMDLVGLTSLIPGPNSTELAMLIGRQRAGLRGLVVAGLAFILPAAAIVLALAWAYVRFGPTPAGEACSMASSRSCWRSWQLHWSASAG